MPVLYPFQEEGSRWLVDHPRGLLADEMGLGKTRQLIVAADNLASGIKLVIGPATARIAWQIELTKLGIPADTICIINSGKDKITKSAEWIIISFSLYRTRTDIQNLVPVCVILDECQGIKNMDTLNSKTIIPLVMRSDIRWFASGTPIKNHYGEFYNLARLMIPSKVLAQHGVGSYTKWKENFCIETKQMIRVKGGMLREVRSIEGSCNPNGLKEVLGPYMLRRRKRDVLKDFPELKWQPLNVRLKDEIRYTKEEIDEAVRLANLGKNPPKGHHQTLRSQLSIAKVPALVEVVKEHFQSTEAPLVIFSYFLEPIAILMANLKKLNITCAAFTGETPPESRLNYVNDFQAGRIQVMVGQTVTAGVAITLTAAWRCLFLDLCWSPADNAQARDRLWRIGQDLDVLAQYLVAENNPLDTRVQEVLARKTRDLDQLERVDES